MPTKRITPTQRLANRKRDRALYLTDFLARLATVTTLVEATCLARDCIAPEGSPERLPHTNLINWLDYGTFPEGATEGERAAYVKLNERLQGGTAPAGS